MKVKMLKLSCLLAFALVIVTSCSKKDTSPLMAECDNISATLEKIRTENPGLLEKTGASYSEGAVTLSLTFADSCISLAPVEYPVVEFFTAMQLKSNGGEQLNNLVNGLNKEKGKLVLDFTDVYGVNKKFDIDAKRLVAMVKEPLPTLNMSAASDALNKILASRCEAYKQQSGAKSVEYSTSNKFATYTFVFDNNKKYAEWNGSNLDKHYIPAISDAMNSFGNYRADVEKFMTTLGIDGFKFVYSATDGSKELPSASPWRMI